MFQWLRGGCARAQVVFRKGLTWRRLSKGVLLALFILHGSGSALANVSAPTWTVPLQLSSDDGYASLSWESPDAGTHQFFKITETIEEKTSVHYTEASSLKARRVQPGEYQFTLQSCVKNNEGLPDCGGASEPLTLEVQRVAQMASMAETAELSSQFVESTSSDGGPGDLRPGSWSSPRKAGHGWHFYWANRLALPENDPLYGTGYDLVGVWLTYEAKSTQADPGCTECPPVGADYLPVAVTFKAISIGPDTFGGGLYVRQGDGSELWIGSIEIEFAYYNNQAVVSWNANFKHESLSDTHSLNYSAGPEPLYPVGISHLSGLWNYTEDSRFYVVTVLGQVGEGSAIVFYDIAGDPTWITATRSGTPDERSRDLCFAYLVNGYSPELDTPDGWTRSYFQSGCYTSSLPSSSNRNGLRYFSLPDTQYLWAEFTLPGTALASGSIQIGSDESPVPMTKSTGADAISYDSATGPSCELNSLTPVCSVLLSWYTDAYYPQATAYAHNLDSDEYFMVATSSDVVMTDVPFDITTAGTYEFELRVSDSPQTSLLAKSGEFLVTEGVGNSPPSISVPPTQTVIQGGSVALSVPVDDIDNDMLSCGDDGTLPAGLSVAISAGNDGCDISGRMLAGIGHYTSTLTVDDGFGHPASGDIDWQVIPGSSNPETPPAPAGPPDMTASSSSSRVGATSGEFRVDETGSAAYSIPILTAPASGGVAPQITLEYSSQRGNGEIGVGWVLRGVSAITRCAQTIEQDGVNHSQRIRLDEKDRFCLDGQRLVADPDKGPYGGDGTEYRTEIDDFARITSFGSAGHGPAWFRVEHKDGSVTEYGNSESSRIEARGAEIPATVLAWAQNRYQDRTGNYMLYSYLEDNIGPVAWSLEAVDYTGNVNAGTSPSARLSFSYRDRGDDTDQSHSYLAGVQIEQKRLLTGIRSQGRLQAGSPLEDLRFYDLDYDQDGLGRHILVAVTECRSIDKAFCFEPTRFDWLKSESVIERTAMPLDGLLPGKTLSGLLLADVSGDGRPDVLYTKTKGTKHYLHVQQATGAATFNEWPTDFSLPKKADKTPPRLFAIDINADGYQDIVYVRYSESTDSYTWVTRLSMGNSLSDEIQLNSRHRFVLDDEDLESRFRVLDFNGDGLSDIMHASTARPEGAWSVSVLLNETTPAGGAVLADPLELDIHNAGLFPFDSEEGWEQDVFPPHFGWESAVGSKAEIPDARVFDFNGDGAVDLLLNVWRDYKRCISNCEQESASERTQTAARNPDYEVKTASFWVLMESNALDSFTRHSVVAKGGDCTFMETCRQPDYLDLPISDHVWPVDLNADGLADLAWGDTNGNWHFQWNTGLSFTDPLPIGVIPEGVNKLVRFVDWNGDGYPDLVYPSAILSDNATWMVYQNHFGRAFAASMNTSVPVANVGGDEEIDKVENDASVFADFTGDGRTDMLLIDNNKRGEITATSLHRGINVSGSRDTEPANVITKITNGFGAVTEISYQPLTHPDVYTRMNDSVSADWGRGSPVYDYTTPIYVVSRVSRSAPVHADQSAMHHEQYHYAGAKLQAGGRGFLGFAEIISYDPQLNIRTNTRFRQDFPFTGLPVDTTRTSPFTGAELATISDMSAIWPIAWPEVSPATQPPANLRGTLLGYRVNQWIASTTVPGAIHVFADTALERSYTLAGNPVGKVLTSNHFDDYGNLTTTTISTYANDNDTAYATRITNNRWSTVQLSSWNLGRLIHSTVTHKRAGEASIVRESAFEHDPVTGGIRREEIEPDDARLGVVTTYSHDPFGNRVSSSVRGLGMNARTSTATFDGLGRFVVQKSNALGQVTYKVSPGQWDVFGNPLEVTDIDGIKTISAADLMGRAFISYREDGSWQKELFSPGAGGNCPAGTAWHSAQTTGGGASGQKCFDTNSRNIRSVSKNITGRLIYVDRYYDIAGRPERVSEPYFKPDTAYWNETAYDKLGRVIAVLSAGGDDSSTDFDERATGGCVAAAPGVSVTRNALGQRVTEVRNVLAETLESYDDYCGRVSFEYDATGNLTVVTGEDGSVTRMVYDGGGRKISLSDPDKGRWRYAYNPLGEMTRQLDSKQQAIDFEYDVLGRVTQRRELKNVTSLDDTAATVVNYETTQYHPVSPGKSKPKTVTYFDGETGAISHKKSMTYDWLGRVSSVSTTVADKQFYQQTTYDEHGRVFQQFDASGDDHGLRYVYRNGHLERIKEAREGVDGEVYQAVLDMDARGNVTLAELGNGVSVFADFDPASGHLVSLRAYDPLGAELQDIAYLSDTLGNFKSRHDLSGDGNMKETFSYDRLNRLKQVRLTAPGFGIDRPVETLALDYDVTGNITWKSDVGVYTYGARPHAVTSAGSASYRYDANGNQVSGDGREITYTVFDKAASLTKGARQTAFTYGIGNVRVQRSDLYAGSMEKETVYLGDVEYISKSNGEILFKRRLGGAGIADYYPVTMVQRVNYLLKDHIGSVHSVLDERGRVITRMHFSPFGERQDVNWQTPLDSFLYAPLNDLTTRGFTGHEHLDDMGVIHMNGRVYDSKLGRFLQADPFVQAPKSTQGLNRYSYAFNNPLSYTDPSGYFSLSRFIKKWGRLIVAAVASYFTFGAAYAWAATSFANMAAAGTFVQGLAAVKTMAAVVAGASAGFVGGAIISGTLRGAVRGAFAGAVTGGISKYYGDTYNLGRVASESIGGGVSARILGGKFEDGLKFALIVSTVTYLNYRMDLAERRNSAQNPDNLNKPGSGLFGRKYSIAGARRTVDPKTGNYLPCGSPAGGCQGLPMQGNYDQKSNLLRIPYSPKEPLGYFVDTFAGPHDWLRNHVSRSYDVLGNSKYFTGFRKLVDQVANTALIPVAAPFSMAALVGTQPFMFITAQGYLYAD